MRYGRKFVAWMIASALAASTFAGCSDSGKNPGISDSGTLGTAPSSAEAQSSSSENTPTTFSALVSGSRGEVTSSASGGGGSSSSHSATSHSEFQVGGSVGETNIAFERNLGGLFGGLIGKRPASGAVTDQKINNPDYDYLKKFPSAKGREGFYRIPQINLRSEAAREFNEYIRKRAEIDLNSVATYIRNNTKALQDGNINGWIYFDYAVVETDRYISIVLFKLNDIWLPNLWVRAESFVYDKDTSKILKLTDLLDDFGVPYEEALSWLESLYPKHNIELKIGDSEYTYMNEYSNYLGRLWNIFYGMDRDASARGLEFNYIEGYEFNFYPSCAVYVAHTDEGDRLRVIHRDARITGTDKTTGNISYAREILDVPFGRSDERKANKAFAALVPDAADDVLGAIVYLGGEASQDVAGKFANLYELDSEVRLSVFSTGRNKKAMYVLIPRYEGSMVRLDDKNERHIADYVAPVAFIFGDEAAPLKIILTSREEWGMFEIPLDRSELDLSYARVVDVTDRVQSIEHEKMGDFLEFLRYRFR